MKKFVLKSPKFQGQVTFGYNGDGHIVYYNNEIPDALVVVWMKRFMPIDHSSMDAFREKCNATITEVPEDLTFDRFWNSYDKKVNRKRAEPLFEKLTEAEKMQAIMCIKAYQEYCYQVKRGIADPERYLRDRFFETDWRKLK